MNDFSFSEVTENDLSMIQKIYNYYVENTTVTFDLKPVSIEQIKAIITFSDPKYKAFAIRNQQSSVLIGYGYISPFHKRKAYEITAEITLYLDKSFHKKGIGQKTLLFLEQYAKGQGIRSIIALISAENLASIHLFEKCKYEKCAHLREVGFKFNRYLDVVYYQKKL
ncbi:MAG: N-acetyltransferase family protein [Spirochaetes bacterium]|nr:N-acetyltransferase family protein [Spirochaetota bacterium]